MFIDREMNNYAPLDDTFNIDRLSLTLYISINLLIKSFNEMQFLHRYNDELTEPNKFKEALKQGPKSPDFTKLVAWLADELAVLNDMDETVHAIVSSNDSSSFLLELSCFLKELGCMNERLMSGNVNERLANEQDRHLLLDFLGAELKTCRLLESRKHKNATSAAVVVVSSYYEIGLQ